MAGVPGVPGGATLSQMLSMRRPAARGVDEAQRKAIADALLIEKQQGVARLVNPQKLAAQQEFFDIPAWAGAPDSGVHLTAKKGSEVLAEIMVDNCPYYLFGRNQAVVDVHLEHPSISRVHCALVHHGASKSVYVVDLGGSYGTQINGTKLEPKKPAKFTEGDTLTIGASSRAYTLSMTPPVVAAPVARKRKADEMSGLPSADAAAHAEAYAAEREEAARAAEREILSRAEAKRVHKSAASFWDKSKQERLQKMKAEAASPPPEADVPEVPAGPVRLSHILLLHEGSEPCFHPVTGASVDRTFEEAVAACTSLRRSVLLNLDGKGTKHSFASAAKKSSECSTAVKKGVLGEIGTKGFLAVLCPREVEAAGRALQPGSVSQVVQSELGVHLVYRHVTEE